MAPAGRRWGAAALLTTLLVTACVGPSRTAEDYGSKANNTVELTRSSLETVLLGLDAAARGRVFLPYLSRLVGDAEEDAGAAQTSFLVVQPPDATSDELRAELGDLLDDATDALADVRIAVRRNDVSAALALAPDIEQASQALEAFLEAHGGA